MVITFISCVFLIHSDNNRLHNRFNCASGGNRWRTHRYSHDHCIVLCHFKHLYNVIFLSMLQGSQKCYQINKESSIRLLRIVTVCNYMIDMQIKRVHLQAHTNLPSSTIILRLRIFERDQHVNTSFCEVRLLLCVCEWERENDWQYSANLVSITGYSLQQLGSRCREQSF